MTSVSDVNPDGCWRSRLLDGVIREDLLMSGFTHRIGANIQLQAEGLITYDSIAEISDWNSLLIYLHEGVFQLSPRANSTTTEAAKIPGEVKGPAAV